MRSAIIAAAFVVSALAVPFAEKRNYVTDTKVEYAYTTIVKTVTAGGKSTPEAVPQKAAQGYGHHKHHQKHRKHGWGGNGWTNTVPTEPATHHHKPTHHHNPTAPHTKPTSQPTSPPSSGGGGGSGSYSSDVLIAHNLHRKNHTVADLAWDDGLAATAQQIAETCVYAHSMGVNGGGYGQNIAAGVPGDNVTAVITDLFYNGEVNNYNGLYGEANPDMSNFENWGHFTQLVWKGSTHCACYTADCSGKGLANVGSDVRPYFTVCNYKSPGNFAGEYGANVLRPIGEPTAQWNTGL